MTDTEVVGEVKVEVVPPDPIPFAQRTVFEDPGRAGLSLTLRKCADQMVQRDLDTFMKLFREQTQGDSTAEDNGKTVRAALRANWIESFRTPQRVVLKGNDVDEIHPGYVRWAAVILDQVYQACRILPNA